MTANGNIRRVSRFGFGVLIAGSLLSGLILVFLLFSLDRLRQEQQTSEDAYNAVFELKYYTERLLTTDDLARETRHWVAARDSFRETLQRLKAGRDEGLATINRLWTVVQSETADVLQQLENPLFQAGYTMDKALLRRLGEGLNANERSEYYIALTQLINSIDYLKQYQEFLLDELETLRTEHATEVQRRLARTRELALYLPGGILLLTLLFAVYSSREIGRIEWRLMDTQADLELSLEKLNQQKEALKHMAEHDALTHLPNRVLLLDRLEHMLEKAARNGALAAVLFVDLDRFKEVNDSLGHSTGDDLLVLVSRRLLAHLRRQDTIARVGGDEFVILLEDLPSPAAIGPVTQKLLASMQQPITVNRTTLYITTSIGISVYPQDGKDGETLLRNADAAMYRAKAEGRNTYRFYTADLTRAAFERVQLETSLRRAMKEGELRLHYQPQYELASGSLIGFEALIRWQHPEHGLILPGRFIPLAEETGLIVSLGAWVLRRACAQAARWHAEGLAPGRIAINIADRQLKSDDFHYTLRQALHESGCRPEWLELEVTEGFVMQNPERSVPLLESFVAMGIDLAIDDFGTGHSSLSYLKHLPVQRLKVDQSFVRGLPGDAGDVAIARAVIALGHDLGLTVIAEGVERSEQRDFLLAEGCAAVQGFLYARPMPAEQATELLRRPVAQTTALC